MKAVNLLPSDQRGSAKTSAGPSSPASSGSAFGAWVVIGVLAFAAAASALYVLTNNTIKDRKVHLAALTEQTNATEARAKSLQRFADFESLARQRVATVKDLASSRFDWEKTLGDLSRALPSDVHLDSLQGSTGSQLSSAGGNSGLTSAIQAPSIALSGCAKSQSGVAQLMSRLRAVRGVTRVSLSKSDAAGAGGATVAATAPGTDGAAQQCPKGDPPTFNVTVYFERAAVAPGASPNLGAGQTTTQTAPSAAAAATGSTSTSTGSSSSATPGSTTAAPASTPAASTAATQGVSSK